MLDVTNYIEKVLIMPIQLYYLLPQATTTGYPVSHLSIVSCRKNFKRW